MLYSIQCFSVEKKMVGYSGGWCLDAQRSVVTSKLKIENYSSFVLRKSLTNECLHSSENLAHFSHFNNMCACDA